MVQMTLFDDPQDLMIAEKCSGQTVGLEDSVEIALGTWLSVRDLIESPADKAARERYESMIRSRE